MLLSFNSHSVDENIEDPGGKRQAVFLMQVILTVSGRGTFSFLGICILARTAPVERITHDLISTTEKCQQSSNKKSSLLEERCLES